MQESFHAQGTKDIAVWRKRAGDETRFLTFQRQHFLTALRIPEFDSLCPGAAVSALRLMQIIVRIVEKW